MTAPKDRARALVRRLPPSQRARLRRVYSQTRRVAYRATRSAGAQRAIRSARKAVGGPKAKPASALPNEASPLTLSTRTEWFGFDVTPYERYLVSVDMATDHADDERAALIQYRFFDHMGRLLRNDAVGKADSPAYGYFDYLPRTPVEGRSAQVVFTPENATTMHVGFRRYKPEGDAAVRLANVSFEHVGPRRAFPAFDLNDNLPPRTSMRIAVVADTFTLDALSRQCQVLALSRSDWRSELDDFEPDLVLIESAWKGNDDEWTYEVVNLTEQRTALRDMMREVSARGIPSLFWNKEDPPHFEEFLEAASLCDYVATTDAGLIPSYRERLGHDRVFALPFAVQADLHSPRKPNDAKGDRYPEAAFLGSWWAEKFDGRRAAQESLLEGAEDNGLAIYDRYFKFNDHERYRFPLRWLRHTHGSLTYDRVLTAYRRFSVVLNVNTVTTSETMFSRRALEAAACGAVVISNPSVGTRAAMGDLVLEASTPQECRDHLQRLQADPDGRDMHAHQAYRHVQRHHRWDNRMQDIADQMNIWVPNLNRARKISVVLATKRAPGANRILEWLATLPQDEIQLEPIVITAFDPAEMNAELVERLGARVERELEHHTLGDCLNRGADLASGNYVAKVDDDDHYGPQYFADLMLSLEVSRADICGKQAHLQYIESADTTVLRYPGSDHRFTNFVCGSTLLMKREIFDQVRFPSRRVGEDTNFLNRARGAGFRLYSADRFGYISMRRADLDSHTWQVEADELLNSKLSARICDGIAEHHLDV